MFDNPLKTVPVKTIEEAVAKVLSELAKTKYTCQIDNLEFASIHGATMTVKLSLEFRDKTLEKLPEDVSLRAGR
jgi:hypothetical protein